MCPACLASAAMVIGGMISTGGAAAVIAKLRVRKAEKESLQSKPEEERCPK